MYFSVHEIKIVVVVKIAHLKDAFSEIFELETSTVEGQSVPQKDKKGEKGKAKKKSRLESMG